MKRFLVFSGLLLLMLQGCKEASQGAIVASVARKMADYPESTLQDLYKSYFQDYFGPGHLVSDTAAAMKYLDYELHQDDYRDTILLDPTGYRGNFYRVNLSLIKDGTIPRDTFFRYFLQSVNSVEGISMEEWKNEWPVILAAIGHTDPRPANFTEDSAYIDSLLSAGEYVVHHSDRYIETYHPHYRLIHREIFDRHLAGYLKER